MLFFDRKPASESPSDEFVACYNPANRHACQPAWFKANLTGAKLREANLSGATMPDGKKYDHAIHALTRTESNK